MLMVCKQTGCAVDVREDAVERFKAAGYVPFERHEAPAEQPEAKPKPKRTRRKPKAAE